MSKLARILLAGANQKRLLPIASRLEETGLPTVTAGSAAAAVAACEDLHPAALIIDGQDITADDATRLSAAVRRRAAIPVIVLWPADAPPAPETAFDAVLRHPVHPAQAVSRVQNALRHGVMKQEAALRQQTLSTLGIQTPDIDASGQGALNVLFVGEADPAFMGLRNALGAARVNVVAAFTSFTAFDYLHDRNFHAIVLNALKNNEPAFTICSALRRNSRLFHVPALILHDPSRFDAADEIFARGASDLLSVQAPEAESADRIVTLARERAEGLAVRNAFECIREGRVLDAGTGLFNRDMCAAHLKAMGEAAGREDRPLSFIAVRANSSALEHARPAPDQLARARNEFGSMLRYLVRPEDFAARLDSGVFLIAMPGAVEGEAEEAAKRISMVSDCSAFAEDSRGDTVRLRMRCAVAERQPGETGIQLLNRAIGGLGIASVTPRPGESVPTGLA